MLNNNNTSIAYRLKRLNINKPLLCVIVLVCLVIFGSSFLDKNKSLPSYSITIDSNQIADRIFKDPTLSPDQKINDKIILMKSICGDVCDTQNDKKFQTGKKFFDYVPELKKQFDCKTLFTNKIFDMRPVYNKPVKTLNGDILEEFSYNKRIDVIFSRYMNERSQDSQLIVRHWTKEILSSLLKSIPKLGYAKGGYDDTQSKELFEMMKKMDISGKKVLVVGSISPWVECNALYLGAKHVTTLEYNRIIVDDPRMTTLLPEEFTDLYLKGKLPQFDAVVSYSSIEHSGLGRYGDGLNPWGDLVTMAKLHCVLPSKAKILVGVPYVSKGRDIIHFNVHKCYGPVLLSHLFANWKITDLVEPKDASDMQVNKCMVEKHQGIYIAQKD